MLPEGDYIILASNACMPAVALQECSLNSIPTLQAHSTPLILSPWIRFLKLWTHSWTSNLPIRLVVVLVNLIPFS